MIFAADTHPVATYVAGCVCIAAMGALAGRIIIDSWAGQWDRIWSLFLSNFRNVAPRAERNDVATID